MNMDQWVEEAFKMRNLLMEFKFTAPPKLNCYGITERGVAAHSEIYTGYRHSQYDEVDVEAGNKFMTATGDSGACSSSYHAIAPTDDEKDDFLDVVGDDLCQAPPPRIVGFTEHIFSESIGSVASFAAAAEYVFGSQMMRVYDKMLDIRMHYGHPDLFDHVWFMQRGGVSKASKGLNLNEDIFAAFNTVLRGGSIVFREFIHCGKGRDLGFNQIVRFEQKLACGAAEQTLSREMTRLGQSFDFARLMSFYNSTVGNWINKCILIGGIYIFVVLQTLFAVSQAFDVAYDDGISPKRCVLDEKRRDVLNDVSLSAWSLLAVSVGWVAFSLPLLVQLYVSRGPWFALKRFFFLTFGGGPVHFGFLMLTSADSFDKVLCFGGAKYQATGRGLAVERFDFIRLWGLYGPSHFRFAGEIVWMLGLWGALLPPGSWKLFTSSWVVWLMIITWVVAPFLFNPFALDWNRVAHEDIPGWIAHITSSKNSRGSLAAFIADENRTYTTAGLGAKLGNLARRLGPWGLIAAGALAGVFEADSACDDLLWLRYFVLSIYTLASFAHSMLLLDFGANTLPLFLHWFWDAFVGSALLSILLAFSALFSALGYAFGLPSIQTAVLFSGFEGTQREKRYTYSGANENLQRLGRRRGRETKEPLLRSMAK